MNMTGEELYEKYRTEYECRGCTVDTWGELMDMDRSVWVSLAEQLQTIPDVE